MDQDRPLHLRPLPRRRLLSLAGATGAAAFLAACGGSGSGGQKAPQGTGASGGPARPAGWSDKTHGNGVDPGYATVFPAGRVLQMEISLSADAWQGMLDDLTTLIGPRGTGGTQPGGGAPPPGGVPPQGGGAPPQGGAPPGGGGRGGDFTPQNPAWAKATVKFDGKTWTNVGFRFKGNSSLNSAWRSGTDRIPFKLDFDQWEQDHPEIADQRFYGFKQLSLSNNFGDASFYRETLAYGLFREAGLPWANTASYEVVLDRGEGSKSLGLYTVIEVVDDTVISRLFKEADGNIYEADGQGATLAASVAGQIKASFEVEGGKNADHADVTKLHSALHDGTRTSDPAAWRKSLESVFEVEPFLEWLALSAAIQHWDTYGAMSHNYYLYNNPENGKLTWISWDHNLVLGATPSFPGGGGGQPPAGGVGGPGGGRGIGRAASLERKETGEQWPLIRFLLDQPEYYERYARYVRDTEKLLDPSALEGRINGFVAEVAKVLPAAEADAQRTAAATLLQNVRDRQAAVKAFGG